MSEFDGLCRHRIYEAAVSELVIGNQEPGRDDDHQTCERHGLSPVNLTPTNRLSTQTISQFFGTLPWGKIFSVNGGGKPAFGSPTVKRAPPPEMPQTTQATDPAPPSKLMVAARRV